MNSGSLRMRALDAAPAVLEYIQTAQAEGRVPSRDELVLRLQLSDRLIRQAVAELRNQGYLLVADEGGGYRFASSYADVMRYTASLKSRIESLRDVIRRMELEAHRRYPDGQDAEQLEMELVGDVKVRGQ